MNKAITILRRTAVLMGLVSVLSIGLSIAAMVILLPGGIDAPQYVEKAEYIVMQWGQ